MRDRWITFDDDRKNMDPIVSGPQQTIEHNHRNGKILVQQSIVLYDCFYMFVGIVTLT